MNQTTCTACQGTGIESTWHREGPVAYRCTWCDGTGEGETEEERARLDAEWLANASPRDIARDAIYAGMSNAEIRLAEGA